MNTIPEPGLNSPKPHSGAKCTAIFLLILLALPVIYFSPSFLRYSMQNTPEPSIYFEGEIYREKAFYHEEILYIPLNFIKAHLDPTILLDEKNQMVIITTDKNVFHLPLGARSGLKNLEPYSFTYPVLQKENGVYLPLVPLDSYYSLEVIRDEKGSAISIRSADKPVQTGIVGKDSRVRLEPKLVSPWLWEVKKDEKVKILKERNGRYWVQTEDGRMGYIDKKKIVLGDIVLRETPITVYHPWNPLGEPIILTWEVAGRTTVNPQNMGDITGVQVLSPTWFHLQENGIIQNQADMRYVKWAHTAGKQVWGLFDNSFNPAMTSTFLHDATLRIKAIKQLLSYVDLYQLDGINIDFENMYLKDKDAFVQFIRELAPLLHEKDRTLTVDVTFHSLSETWSMCYDRKNIAKYADYLMVMAYDEHGGSSLKAGSVASLSWVEQGLRRMLEEVPADKLLLGVPFYTRLWTEETDEQGGKKVTSRALSMEKAESWVKEKGAAVVDDAVTGQRYVEVKEGNRIYRMWLEDAYSLKKRVELMKKYRLAGLAAWRRGFEKDGIWPAVAELANKRW